MSTTVDVFAVPPEDEQVIVPEPESPIQEPEELVITLERRTHPVTFKAKDKEGKERVYKGYLKELEGHEREEYIDIQTRRVVFNDKGKPSGLKPLKDSDQWLICRGLVMNQEGSDDPIIITRKGEANAKIFIRQFGGYFQSKMAKIIRNLSDIQEGDEESIKAKKDEVKNG